MDQDEISYDPDTDSYVVDVTLDGPDAPADAVVTAIAAVRDCDPTDLPPLGTVVDADALCEVVSPRGVPADDVQVAFDYGGFRVTVSGEGELRLVGG